MFFIILTLLSALLLEGIGTIVSVIGLVQLFGYTELIVALAIAFDIAKVTSVTVLYREWGKMSKLLRTYLTVASFVLMTITSMGAASYLSTNFQKSSLPVKTLEVKVKSMTEEKVKLEIRKKEIDAQIANLPSDYVKGRTKLLNNFKTEIERINNRIVQLDVEVPKVQTEMIDATSHAGPIMYLATALKSTPEAAMGWLIGLMIFVFDPLAVALILAGNYLVAQRTPKEIKAPLLPIRVKELIEDIPLDKELPSGFELDDEKEEDYNPQYFWNDYPTKDVNESHHDLELEPLEDRDEESIEAIHEENEDPDKNFYPYFSPSMVEQAKSVAKLPEVEEEKPPVEQSSLSFINDSREEVSFFDGQIPSSHGKNYGL
jgi:hypothetical protein